MTRISVAFRSKYRGVAEYDAFAAGRRVGIVSCENGRPEYRLTEHAAPAGVTAADIAEEYAAERNREDERVVAWCKDQGLAPSAVRASFE